MLTTAAPIALPDLPADPTSVTMHWLTEPVVGEVVETERCELAPGVWIVRKKHWLPITAFELEEEDDSDLAPPLRRLSAAWHRWALCGRLPLETSDPIFFGMEGRAPQYMLANAVDEARAMCRGCPVRRQCLTAALTNDEEYGVWGGTSGRQRIKLRARLQAGEPIEDLVDECLSR